MMKAKKLMAMVLCGAVIASMSAPVFADGEKIGVSMPTKDLQRWNQDGDNMKAELEAAGFTVDLQYASSSRIHC